MARIMLGCDKHKAARRAREAFATVVDGVYFAGEGVPSAMPWPLRGEPALIHAFVTARMLRQMREACDQTQLALAVIDRRHGDVRLMHGVSFDEHLQGMAILKPICDEFALILEDILMDDGAGHIRKEYGGFYYSEGATQ